MIEELKALVAIKNLINDNQFRILVATIATRYFIKNSDIQSKKTILLNKVNQVLKTMDLEPVSYGFIRKFN